MVCAVLSSPMAAVEGQNVGGVGLAGGEAGDAVNGFVAFAQRFLSAFSGISPTSGLAATDSTPTNTAAR